MNLCTRCIPHLVDCRHLESWKTSGSFSQGVWFIGFDKPEVHCVTVVTYDRHVYLFSYVRKGLFWVMVFKGFNPLLATSMLAWMKHCVDGTQKDKRERIIIK